MLYAETLLLSFSIFVKSAYDVAFIFVIIIIIECKIQGTSPVQF